MADAIVAKGERSALAVCSLNQECQSVEMVDYRIDRDECKNRLWEMDVTWFFKCVKGGF